MQNFEISHDIFTAHKRSCRKVMFLHLSVILFTWEVPSRGQGFHPGVGKPPRGCHPKWGSIHGVAVKGRGCHEGGAVKGVP